jgi:hypothetical protein
LETQNVQRNKQDSHAATHGADALEKSEHREFGTRTVIDVMQAYYEVSPPIQEDVDYDG